MVGESLYTQAPVPSTDLGSKPEKCSVMCGAHPSPCQTMASVPLTAPIYSYKIRLSKKKNKNQANTRRGRARECMVYSARLGFIEMINCMILRLPQVYYTHKVSKHFFFFSNYFLIVAAINTDIGKE